MAGIIKAWEHSESGPRPTLRAFQFHDVGQSYLARIRSEAAQIITQAREEAARIKTNATEEGREAAIQAAQATLRTRLEQQLTNVLGALEQAAKQIDQSRHTWQQYWEQHAVQLAAAIAARICRRELSHQPEISVAWIREAVQLAAGNAEVILRLHPDDVATLASQIESITKQMTSLAPARVVADESISRGGCRVDTEFGSIDQQLESQLARITEDLLA